MRLIIDANILVAAFLKAATTRNLLLDDRLELFSPEHLLLEGRKVLKERFARKPGPITEPTFDELFTILTDNVHILSKEEYALFWRQALEIAPHKEDAPYLACALHRSIPLWSNDTGMKEQTLVKVFSTTDLLRELEKA